MKCSRCGLEIQGEDEFANYGATQTHFVGSCLPDAAHVLLRVLRRKGEAGCRARMRAEI